MIDFTYLGSEEKEPNYDIQADDGTGNNQQV